jgi:hypothetical protein
VGTPAVVLVAREGLLSAVSPLGAVVRQTKNDDTWYSRRRGGYQRQDPASVIESAVPGTPGEVLLRTQDPAPEWLATNAGRQALFQHEGLVAIVSY